MNRESTNGKLPFGLKNGVSNLFLDLEQRTSFARQLHLVEDNLHDLAEDFRLKLADKLLEHLLFARHWLGADEIGARDLGAVLLQSHVLIGSLTTEPQGKSRYLAGPQVDVDAVQVVCQYQPGDIPLEGIQCRVVLLQRRAKVRVGVGFLVDR
ncbi:MAG: hypothetical protein JW395_1106 [Nitrospira sp.]|nr:hypothetical protein [Nitrospira sp.]